MSENFSAYIDKFGTEKNELNIIRFFLIFSRFEYALKQSGYLKDKKADPDWDAFGKSIRDKDSISHLLAVGKYILDHPPKRQIQIDTSLGWENTPFSRDLNGLLILIRRIRNNLFHGGKTLSGPGEEVARDTKLITDSYDVLKNLLLIPEASNIQYYFEQVN